MPLTVERVIVLKTVSIFREIPEEYLVELADSLEEVEMEPGDEVIRKGEPGSDLYVIVQGRMRVHDGERFIAELGPREVFGELAALDPEVRSATVTAEEEGLLFRVSRRMLFDLMAERSEVAQGIISVLARRIRTTIGAGAEE